MENENLKIENGVLKKRYEDLFLCLEFQLLWLVWLMRCLSVKGKGSFCGEYSKCTFIVFVLLHYDVRCWRFCPPVSRFSPCMVEKWNWLMSETHNAITQSIIHLRWADAKWLTSFLSLQLHCGFVGVQRGPLCLIESPHNSLCWHGHLGNGSGDDVTQRWQEGLGCRGGGGRSVGEREGGKI